MRLAIPGGMYKPAFYEPLLSQAKRAVKRTKEAIIFSRSTKNRGKKGGLRKVKIASKVKNTTPTSLLTPAFFTIFSLITVSIFLLVMRGVPGNPTAAEIGTDLQERSGPFELSPERGRYAILMSLDESRSFALSAELRDVVYPDVGYIDGRNYSFFAPGISLLVYPFFVLGKQFELSQVVSFGAISLFAIGNMLIIYKIARKIFALAPWAALFASLVFAFGSTSLPYANSLYQHHATTLFILTSFFAVFMYAQKKRFSFLWASLVWLLYGVGIWIDYPNAILMFPVMLYLLFETISFRKIRKKILFTFRWGAILTSIIFFILIGIHGYYNYVNFGSPAKVSGSLIGYKAIKELKLLEEEKGKETLKQIENRKQLVGFFKEENFPKGSFVLLADTDRGIFFYSPILLLGAVQILSIIKRMNRQYAILCALIGTNLFLYASFGDPWGGYAYGPRYLIPSMAILSIFTGELLFRNKRQFVMKTLSIPLFLYSASVAVLGAITTNAIPPKVEAMYLKSAYNYLLNLQLLEANTSSSYIYNTFLSTLSLQTYFLIIYCLVLSLLVGTLFILPALKTYDN